MNKTGLKALILLCLTMSALADTTYVSGAVSGVWDTSGSPYVIEDSTWFEDTLIIEPGVEVILHSSILLCDSSYIRVLGAEDSIYFYGNENSLYIADLYGTFIWNVVFEKCVFTGFDNIQVPAWFNECRFIDSDFGDRRYYRGYHPTTKCVFENCDITGYAEIFENCLITGDSITLFAPGSMRVGGLYLYSCTIYGNGLIAGEFISPHWGWNYVYAMNCLIVGNPSFTYEWFHGYNSQIIETSDTIYLNRIFLDYPHGNFHLADSSAAIGAGDTTFLRYYFYLEDDTLVIDHDLDGNPRPDPPGSMPDLGCYENPRAIAEAIDEAPSARPADIAISGYPNPFNSAVTISLAGASHASPAGVEIFDINGRMVDVIARRATPDAAISPLTETDCHAFQARNDGYREYIWQPDATLGSGVYLVRATFPQQTASAVCTKRVVYLK